MSDFLDTYGKRLKYFRLSKNITQEVLEAKSNVDRALISRYERGLDIPNESTRKKLALALEVDISAFISTPISNVSLEKRDNKKSDLFDKKEFANRLRFLRKQIGLSQVQLSLKSKIYHGQIAKYEREYSTPSLDNSILLADALGVTIDYLLRGKNTNSTNDNILDSNISNLLLQIKDCSIKEKESVSLVLNSMLNGFKKLKETA